MLCTAAAVTAIAVPAAGHPQPGRVTLADGTALVIHASEADGAFVRGLRAGDRLEVCFGPERNGDRPGLAVDTRSGETLASSGIAGRAAQTFPPVNGAKRRTL